MRDFFISVIKFFFDLPVLLLRIIRIAFGAIFFTVFYISGYGLAFPLSILSKISYQLFILKNTLLALRTLLVFPIQYAGYLLLTPIMTLYMMGCMIEDILNQDQDFEDTMDNVYGFAVAINHNFMFDVNNPSNPPPDRLATETNLSFLTVLITSTLPVSQVNLFIFFIVNRYTYYHFGNAHHHEINPGQINNYPQLMAHFNAPTLNNSFNHALNIRGFQYTEDEMRPLLNAAFKRNNFLLTSDEREILNKANNADIRTLLEMYDKFSNLECETMFEPFPNTFEADKLTYVLFKEFESQGKWTYLPHSSHFYLSAAMSDILKTNKNPTTRESISMPQVAKITFPEGPLDCPTRYRWHPYFIESQPDYALSAELDYLLGELRKALDKLPRLHSTNANQFVSTFS
jgi:hypothetical protein